MASKQKSTYNDNAEHWWQITKPEADTPSWVERMVNQQETVESLFTSPIDEDIRDTTTGVIHLSAEEVQSIRNLPPHIMAALKHLNTQHHAVALGQDIPPQTEGKPMPLSKQEQCEAQVKAAAGTILALIRKLETTASTNPKDVTLLTQNMPQEGWRQALEKAHTMTLEHITALAPDIPEQINADGIAATIENQLEGDDRHNLVDSLTLLQNLETVMDGLKEIIPSPEAIKKRAKPAITVSKTIASDMNKALQAVDFAAKTTNTEVAHSLQKLLDLKSKIPATGEAHVAYEDLPRWEDVEPLFEQMHRQLVKQMDEAAPEKVNALLDDNGQLPLPAIASLMAQTPAHNAILYDELAKLMPGTQNAVGEIDYALSNMNFKGPLTALVNLTIAVPKIHAALDNLHERMERSTMNLAAVAAR